MSEGGSSGSTASIPEPVRYKTPPWQHDHISTSQSLITALAPPQGGQNTASEPPPSQLCFFLSGGNKKKQKQIQRHDIIESPLPHGGSRQLRPARPPRDSRSDPAAFWGLVSTDRVQRCGSGWFDCLNLENSTLKLPKPEFSNTICARFEKLTHEAFRKKPRFPELPLNHRLLLRRLPRPMKEPLDLTHYVLIEEETEIFFFLFTTHPYSEFIMLGEMWLYITLG